MISSMRCGCVKMKLSYDSVGCDIIDVTIMIIAYVG